MTQQHPSDDAGAFSRATEMVRVGESAELHAKSLYDRLANEERLALLDGDIPFWAGVFVMAKRYNERPYIHGAVERLGIPGIRFVDGPRGCVAGEGTAFPVPMARGATWNISLEEQIGEIIGREVQLQGGNFFGGVCINLPRHPAWGRAQETYGDEPHHLGEFGAALTRGVQKSVMACVKHYALNSMENARFNVDVTVSEADLHDVYLPHFKRCVDEGVDGVMSAYNAVNGEWAGENTYLLTEVLRNQWNWSGITISDFVLGFRDSARSLNAGLDLEAPMAQQRATHLLRQIEAGESSWNLVERAGVRLLAAQLRFHAKIGTAEPKFETMASEEARALARSTAADAIVLLRNELVGSVPVLPLDRKIISKIAVIGRLATSGNMGDRGSSNVRAPSHVTPLDGIIAAFPDAIVTLSEEDDPAKAAAAARDADVAIIIAGFDYREEGEFIDQTAFMRPELVTSYPPPPEDLTAVAFDESGVAPAMDLVESVGGDRLALTLRGMDEEIILAVVKANPRTVVSIVAAGAVLTEAWRQKVPAILISWYGGMEGGRALADVLTGRKNPAGRLPFSIPTSADHLPYYDRDATHITYDRFYGQRLLDKLGVDAAYPHGFGLSYTTFKIENASVSLVNGSAVTITAVVSNTGERDGRHVIQVYGKRNTGPYQGQIILAGFASVDIAAKKSVQVPVPVSLWALAAWDSNRKQRILPDLASILLEIGSYAHDPLALTCRLIP